MEVAMNIEDRKKEIRAKLDSYVQSREFSYNPDSRVVERIVNGLAAREGKTGNAYCPCRLTTGNPDEDKKIICPCEFHEDEIENDGHCYCNLFVKDIPEE
jgi:ferredoxin-thioredoxin reductase catalytic subunit